MQVFNYQKIIADRHAMKAVVEHIQGPERLRVTESGGTFYGLWATQFGLSSNEAIVITAWSDIEQATSYTGQFENSCSDILESSSEILTPTIRPLNILPPLKPGVYVHRSFTIDAGGLDEFLQLSGDSWPSFERNFECEIIGLFRNLNVQDKWSGEKTERLLLLTHYGTLAVWEDTRNPDKDPKAWKNFMRRHELTFETAAISTQIVLPT